MIRQLRGGRLILAALLALGVSACSATYTNHGYIPPAEDLEMILPGVDTRDSVAESIGRPAASGVVSENTWLIRVMACVRMPRCWSTAIVSPGAGR